MTYRLMPMQVGCSGVQQVEDFSKLDVFLDDLFLKVENLADVVHLAGSSKRPHALKFGIVQ